MKAIFIGGPLDRKYRDIPDLRQQYFVAVPPEFRIPLAESMPIEPCWKRAVYERTQSTDIPVYVYTGEE